ncbi:MAG: redox-regulated ATPase YchF [Candidatus Schekmanbacteria bacterium]|nr:MAG: redox-regulated ATPase YchF [Candidatus Schekmanbacteria bacterium]
MGFNCGIVGLPNAGKSTIFNALTKAGAQTASYPFCTIEPNTGIAKVPDERLDKIAEIVKPDKVVPATLQFTDIAGLVKGASKGEGLGNQFLSHIRNVDAVMHILRAFNDENITHSYNEINPLKDAEIVNTELLLADLQTVEKRLDKAKTSAKSGDKRLRQLVEDLEKIKMEIERGVSARNIPEVSKIPDLFLLTRKPVLYVINIDETDTERNKNLENLISEIQLKEKSQAITICGKLEEEALELEEDERKEFLKEMGINESALEKIIKSGYSLLDLITFFTTRSKEVRAWTIKRGATAYDAAGKIHTDFQRGFIKAEIYPYEDLIKLGSEHLVREKGLMKLEGKEYVVKDGDIIHFKFNV